MSIMEGLWQLSLAAALGLALLAIKLYLATHPLQPRHDRRGRRKPTRPRRHLRRVS